MAVKTYKRMDKIRLSESFQLDEFKCKCGKCDFILMNKNIDYTMGVVLTNEQ